MPSTSGEGLLRIMNVWETRGGGRGGGHGSGSCCWLKSWAWGKRNTGAVLHRGPL